MDDDVVLYEEARGVATLTLNRPAVMNAFDERLNAELLAGLQRARQRGSIGAVIITGAGRAFCSGQDLRRRQQMVDAGETLHLGASLRELYKPVVLAIRQLDRPVIAAVNGPAAGAGCSLALACDLRLCSDRASFAVSFVRAALVPDSGASFFLPRLVGVGRALELVLSGEAVSAAEAVQIGLANQVVPHEELLTTARALAERLARGPRQAIGNAKYLINRSLAAELETMLDLEASFQEVAGQSEDYREAIGAFFEKRPPRFSGDLAASERE